MPDEDIHDRMDSDIIEPSSDNAHTPLPRETPFQPPSAYPTQTPRQQSVWDQSSFTPNVYNVAQSMSPTSPSMNDPYPACSPSSPMMRPLGAGSGTPYIMSPMPYSPNQPRSSVYSPTNPGNPYQSPAYSPTTPSYGAPYGGGSSVPTMQ